MKTIILNNGKAFNKNFNIGGFIIPQFGDIKDGLRFDDANDAKNILNSIPSNIANDCIIAKDIWNI